MSDPCLEDGINWLRLCCFQQFPESRLPLTTANVGAWVSGLAEGSDNLCTGQEGPMSSENRHVDVDVWPGRTLGGWSGSPWNTPLFRFTSKFLLFLRCDVGDLVEFLRCPSKESLVVPVNSKESLLTAIQQPNWNLSWGLYYFLFNIHKIW